jgi:capsular exopolysaccharide synthesis family protein
MAADARVTAPLGLIQRYHTRMGQDTFDCLALSHTLWRCKTILVGCVAAVLTLTAAYASRIPATFEAETLVLLAGGEALADTPGTALAAARAREDSVRSALLEFRSIDMAERMMDELSLHLVSEFNAALDVQVGNALGRFDPTPFLDRMPGALADVLVTPIAGQSDQEQALRLRAEIAGRVMASIAAEATDRPAVIRMKFRSSDPGLAALGADTLAKLYLAEQFEATHTASLAARAFLAGETVRLREVIANSNLQSLKDQVTASGPTGGAVAISGRTAKADRDLLEIYGNRLRQIDIRKMPLEPGAKIIAGAITPETPIDLRLEFTYGTALLGALLVGSLAALGLERMDQTIRNAEQIENLVALPTLALIPAIAGAHRWHTAPDRHVLDYQDSAFGQAVTALAAMLRADEAAQRTTTLVTSAVANEGKTSMSLCLARACGRSGMRTVLIECDVRQPRLHELIGGADRQGLSDVLLGRKGLDEVVRLDDRSGAFLVAAGTTLRDSTALLTSEAMRQVLHDAADGYDLVILDGPSVLSGPDARVLAQLADRTLFLMKWGSTRRQDAVTAVRQLVEAGADIAGVVLNQVKAIDAESQA